MATSIAPDRENGGMSGTEPEARLLVVEDEPNILELLSASLRLAGFEVATATGGLEALQAAQRPPGAAG
jgi:two-component system, OmpR family, response regulator